MLFVRVTTSNLRSSGQSTRSSGVQIITGSASVWADRGRPLAATISISRQAA
jgi:hypothetical protein